MGINYMDMIKCLSSCMYRRGFLVSIFCGMLTVLSGCAVGPDYVRPTADTPVSYKENAGWKVAEPGDTAIKGAWWEIYNNPELNALEEQVNVSNQTIAVAEAQFRQATALVQTSRAALFPGVTTRSRRLVPTR